MCQGAVENDGEGRSLIGKSISFIRGLRRGNSLWTPQHRDFHKFEALLPEMNLRHVSDDGIVELLLPAASANAIVR